MAALKGFTCRPARRRVACLHYSCRHERTPQHLRARIFSRRDAHARWLLQKPPCARLGSSHQFYVSRPQAASMRTSRQAGRSRHRYVLKKNGKKRPFIPLQTRLRLAFPCSLCCIARPASRMLQQMMSIVSTYQQDSLNIQSGFLAGH
jgi:hypothetical protein